LSRANAYQLGIWTYKPASACLIGPTETRQLTPQLNRLLAALLKADERTLSKESLLEEVWSGRIVTDDAIARAISELRKVLRWDGCAEPIRTLHGFGYRLDPEIFEASTRKPLNKNWIIFGIVIAALLASYLLLREERPGLQSLAVTPMSEFNRLDAANRYLPITQHLLYLTPGVSGQSLYLSTSGAPRPLVTDRQFENIEARPDGQQVAYIDVSERCELHLLTIATGENPTLANCLDKASHALGFSPDGGLLFGQLSGDRMSLFTFHSGDPQIEDIDATGCERLKHVAQRRDGRTYVSCAVARSDVLFEISKQRLVERLPYRSIAKFAVDDGEAFYLLHAPHWKAGITRFVPPDDFAFLQTGWVLDLTLAGSRLVMVRDLTNPDLLGLDLEDGAKLLLEEGAVRTQAFTVDGEGSLWQLDDRAGQLGLYRNDQAVPLLDKDMLDFTFADVNCMAVDADTGTIEFSVRNPEGAPSHARHDLGTGALLAVTPETDCASDPPMPAEISQKVSDPHLSLRQPLYDRPRDRWLYIIDRTPYIDIASLEIAPSL